MIRRSGLWRIAWTIGVAACGSPSAPPPAATIGAGADAGDDAPPPDAQVPWAGPYPADHVGLPKIAFAGGFVLTRPEIVTVAFDADPLDAAIRAFADGVGATDWWARVKEGYCDWSGSCIDRVTHKGHVVLPPLDASFVTSGFVDSVHVETSSLRTFVRDQIDAGRLPEPTPQTLYMLFFPFGVPISVEELEACTAGGFSGYHDSTTRHADGTGTRFAYAVLPRCSFEESTLQKVASHELVEAATDPFRVRPGYKMNDLLWTLTQGGEVADMCVDGLSGHDDVVEAGLTLQRSWSNLAVARGTNPCVPVPPGEVYFNLAPSESTIALAYGATTQIALQAFSDGPVDDWKVAAYDYGESIGADTPYLKVELDRATANNGTQLVLTVTAIRPAPHSGLGAPFLLVSRSAEHTHTWPGVVYGR